MSEYLIPAKIVNLVTPSILSIPNSTLKTSMDDLSSFIDTPMTDDTANYLNDMLHRDKENNDTMLKQTKKTMILRVMLL